MAENLLIVESPTKARTLKKYLGSQFDVKASVGHVIDLPKNRIGVDVEHGYEPQYEVLSAKKKVVKEIVSAAKKARNVYLGPDPDREGEAIAWHIASQLPEGKTVSRVLFNEITKSGVSKALEQPVELDRDKFEAQQARRILDRLVGYNLSPLLWKKVRKGLSAGRVQSVAVRLIAEREREIRAFDPVEYWSITAALKAQEPPPFKARLAQWQGKKIEIGNETLAKDTVAGIQGNEFKITKIKKRQKKVRPQPPFVTAKLMQDAATRLRYTTKRTMALAQRLYEGVSLGPEGEQGLITYMRTDSMRVSQEAVREVRSHIRNTYGGEHLPDKPNFYKNKDSAQDAHEAIRPVSMRHTPSKVKPFLEKDLFALYELIWNRFVASQMLPAVFDQTQVEITAGDATFAASGSIRVFSGFQEIYGDLPKKKKKDDEDEEDSGELPPLEEGMILTCTKIDPKQHFTKPPPRFTEAALVKELEDKGIGRPSTYAQIMATIQNKEYVVKEKNAFRPTELGMTVTDLLVDSFPNVLSVEFTARMEEELDDVEQGKRGWTTVLDDFYEPFSSKLDEAQEGMKNLKREAVPTDIDCDRCGAQMVLRWGKNGRFLACSAYPECTNTKNVRLDEDGTIHVEKEEVTEHECPKCGAPMVLRRGRNGRFLACSKYPECKSTQPLPTGVKCPRENCDGELVERTSQRGKVFFGCNRFPTCDYVSWDRPVPEACPICENPFLVIKQRRAGDQIACPNRQCNYKRDFEEAG